MDQVYVQLQYPYFAAYLFFYRDAEYVFAPAIQLLDRCAEMKVLFRVQLLDYEKTKKVSECYEFDYDEQVRASALATE